MQRIAHVCVAVLGSVSGNFGSDNPVVSANGRIVTFESKPQRRGRGCTNVSNKVEGGYRVRFWARSVRRTAAARAQSDEPDREF